MGEEGLIRQAEKAGEHHANGVASEQDAIDSLLQQLGTGGSGQEENEGQDGNKGQDIIITSNVKTIEGVKYIYLTFGIAGAPATHEELMIEYTNTNLSNFIEYHILPEYSNEQLETMLIEAVKDIEGAVANGKITDEFRNNIVTEVSGMIDYALNLEENQITLSYEQSLRVFMYLEINGEEEGAEALLQQAGMDGMYYGICKILGEETYYTTEELEQQSVNVYKKYYDENFNGTFEEFLALENGTREDVETMAQQQGITYELMLKVMGVQMYEQLLTINVTVSNGDSFVNSPFVIYVYEVKQEGTYTFTAELQDGSGRKGTTTVNVASNTENTIGPNGKLLVTTITTTEHTGTSAEDTLGNPVYVPGGFKIASDSGSTVKEGIVVEDSSGNQFVWIPVSNTNHDGSNKIKVDENTEVEITLGRYTFDTTTGTETKVQYASEYATTTLEAVTAAEKAGTGEVLSYRAGDYYYELTGFRDATQVFDTTGTNATAKDLAGFIDSVSTNKGYYLARYEASYSSGSTFGIGDNSAYYKPASKVSTANSTDSMSYTTGTLWNFITQGNASIACRQMYYGNSYIESDLCNSYAWDTAIVYIQAMGNNNYANQTDGNGTLKNTGDTGDEKCKIFDMASNCVEWTTEYSTFSGTEVVRPCTVRGSLYLTSDLYTSFRNDFYATNSGIFTTDGQSSFRPLLYIN